MKKKNFKISLVFVYTILIVWALTTIFPLLWSIMNSFKNKKAIYNNSFALPVDKLFSLDNYKAVFANYDILNAYRNSFIISGTVAVVVILFSGMAAYILTRYKFPGKGILDALLYAGMMFPIYSTIIPVLRMMTGWGIVNTPHVSLNLLSVILPQIAGNMSFAIIVLRSYMRGLPVELEEVQQIRSTMLEQGALCSVMTGSGAAVFGLFPNRESAESACAVLRKQVPFAEVCHTL